MKTIKSVLFAVLFSCTLFSLQAADHLNSFEQSLQSQISELLVNADFWEAEDAGTRLQVRFLVSASGEIVVLGTDSEEYDKAIKSLLNYEKIDIDSSLHNKPFIVPVRLDQ